MNIKVGDKVLYKSLAVSSIGTIQKILGDSYYIINNMVVYSFEVLKNLSAPSWIIPAWLQ